MALGGMTLDPQAPSPRPVMRRSSAEENIFIHPLGQ
jgi:hypothetical protein